jgi:hypothetical protein
MEYLPLEIWSLFLWNEINWQTSTTKAIAVCSSGLFAAGDLIFHKKFLKKAFRLYKAFLCHAHGLRFAYRIGNKAFFMKAVHCVPIKTFPGSCPKPFLPIMDD